jgi:hypothetical protein
MIVVYMVAFLFYVSSVWLSYSDKLKTTNWYFPLGMFFAIVCNVLWLYVAKHTPSKQTLYINALIWDLMIVGTYSIMPAAFFGVRFAPINLIGVVMVVTGMILTKV